MAKKYNGTFTGVGKGLNYVGSSSGFSYAYSGLVGIDDSGVLMLDFQTGVSFVNATVTYGNSTTSGDDIQFLVKINGETVMATHTRGPVNSSNAGLQPAVILPPHSRIEVTGTNFSSSTPRLCIVSIIGRVYE